MTDSESKYPVILISEGVDRNRELLALIKLLDDEDDRVYTAVHNKLKERGLDSIRELKSALVAASPLVKERIGEAIRDIQCDRIHKQFRLFANLPDDEVDLETGSFMIAQLFSPETDMTPYREILDSIAVQIQPQIGLVRFPLEVIRTVNRAVFDDFAFKGNTEKYYEPENSFIHKVLEKKLGIPITLCLVYLFVAKRLGLPFFGVAMPAHFILKYETEHSEIFIDPFNAGAILTKQDCVRFLTTNGYSYAENMLRPARNKEILSRLMQNLIAIYSNTGDHAHANDFAQLLKILNNQEGDFDPQISLWDNTDPE
jgi:regulator of sirC expression with transglutaminase-like and TPR domain